MPKKTYKIGFDARMFGPKFTGIGRYSYELLTRFFDREWWEQHMQDAPIGFDNIRWKIFMSRDQAKEYKFPPNVKKIRMNAAHYSYSEQAYFPMSLYKANCHLVHFPNFNIPVAYKWPYVTTVHDLTIHKSAGHRMNSRFKRSAYKLAMWNALRFAREVLTVSAYSKSDILKYYPTIKEENVHVTHLGAGEGFPPVSAKEKKEILKKFNVEEGKYILYNSNWREHKNLPNLIRAFAIMRDKVPGLKLLVTGRPDPHNREPYDVVQELKLEKDVILYGLVEESDRIALFHAALAHVLPSLHEGFGITPLEAMSVGLPVAVSDISCIPEICGDGAHYFDPHDIDDMAAKITEVCTDQKLRKKLIDKGYKRIKEFSWDRAARETLQVYFRALKIKP